jgi:hypothetical protein
MYDMITSAYLSSKSEVASLVRDECESTGTIFKGNYATNNESDFSSNDDVINKWKKILNQ